MKLKILQIIPDLNISGAEIMLENLIMGMNLNKYEIKVVSFYNIHTILTDRIEKSGIEIIYLNKTRGFDITLYKKIFKTLKKEKPDILHTHRHTLLYTVIPGRIYKKDLKMIHTVHNIASKEVPKYSLFLQKIFFKYLKVIPVAISKNIQQTICKQYKLKEKQVPIIFNGIQLNNCIKKDNYKKTNNILNIGRFAEQKNHDEMIEIFKEVLNQFPYYKLKLIGEGQLKNTIIEKVKTCGLTEKVEFCGIKDNCYLDLNHSDIFILTSKWEGFPIALIEAMGTGVPCIAYGVGGITEIIDDGYSGFIAKDKEDFVKTIIKLIEDDSLRERIGKNAVVKSKEFSSFLMRSKYIEVYTNERGK